MAKFSYTVINNQNQQLTGTINAPNIKSARDELNHLGLSVISIEEINDIDTTEVDTENETFEFEAFDTTGRKVLGRIKESDKQAAYERLRAEYNFEVMSLYPSNLSPQEKNIEKQKGLAEIASGFQEKLATNRPEEEAITSEFEAKQKVLQEKITTIIQKVEEFLTQFAGEIKKEEEKNLRDQIDKIKLIKNSTNLEHIEGLAENILNTIQKQKIFLHRDQFMKEKTTVTIEAKKMVSNLHKSQPHSSFIYKPSSISFLSKIEESINSLFKQDPEILKIKEEIRNKNANILEYGKLFLGSGTSEEKEEIKARIYSLYEERKSLKQKLHDTKQALSKKLIESPSQDFFVNITEQMHAFTGWLLFFYLTYYFIGLYLSTKQMIYEQTPAGFSIYDTFLLKYLLPIILISHIFLGIKRLFYPKNIILDIIGIPTVILASLIITFNF